MSQLTITVEDYQRLLGQAIAERDALKRYVVELEQRLEEPQQPAEPSEER